MIGLSSGGWIGRRGLPSRVPRTHFNEPLALCDNRVELRETEDLPLLCSADRDSCGDRLMAGEPILIVDDNQANLKLARVVLSTEGYLVQTATDAAEALKVLEEFTPQLILMDIQLPGSNGLELTQKLKSDPRWRSVVIIAFTAYAMKGDEEKAKAAGCDGYLTKPISIKTLGKVVGDYLKGGQRPSNGDRR
jgi:two-component system, cell cycle response regulator DivK